MSSFTASHMVTSTGWWESVRKWITRPSLWSTAQRAVWPAGERRHGAGLGLQVEFNHRFSRGAGFHPQQFLAVARWSAQLKLRHWQPVHPKNHRLCLPGISQRLVVAGGRRGRWSQLPPPLMARSGISPLRHATDGLAKRWCTVCGSSTE